MSIQTHISWIFWLIMSVVTAIYIGYKLTGPDHGKEMFLIGETTHGHYQIEMACSACHKESFAGIESLQTACMDCHGEELSAVDDSHPKSKFTDPRNADRVEILDARYCITCHKEHNKDITNNMGLTLQEDYCFRCHSNVADERPTHKGLAFDSCASAGCHNYHDNTALYEDFIEKHLDEPDHYDQGRVLQRDLASFIKATLSQQAKPLSASNADMPDASDPRNTIVIEQWEKTRHAMAGVNCSDCHSTLEGNASWTDKPAIDVCKNCHDKESEGFLSGKHGMRLGQNLSPMTPGMARQAMKPDSHTNELTCNSCHMAHDYDTTKAAYEQCLTCHNDEHSLAYEGSPHHDLWLQEINKTIESGKGVSCSTCHMPRELTTEHGVKRTLVQHNQNANLRPNEKMMRGVCMKCHGLDFTINALADPELIRKNFSGPPSARIQSTEWVKKRVLEQSNQ